METSNDIFAKASAFTRAQSAKAEGWYPYFQPISSGADAEVTIRGRKVVMIGSNNYLGLTQHPYVIEMAQKAISDYGSGCTGSRFLNGNLELHEELEERLARFMDKPACLVFSTGYQTNLGTIDALAGRHDRVLSDAMNHASIFDANRLSFAKAVKYRHNDLSDLERLLKEDNGLGGTLVVTDGVFSMEGDLAELQGMSGLRDQYGFRLMVDDAHGVGVMGANGRGTAEHFRVEKAADIIMGTFSKSLASIGGFIVSDAHVIDYVKHHSRALIFSASPPPAAVAAVIAALDIIEAEPERRQRLWENVNKMRDGYRQIGLDVGPSETPVIPLVIGEEGHTFYFWNALFEAGIFTNPIVPPAVPQGKCLLRTSYMATHTTEMLDHVLDVVAATADRVGLTKTAASPAL
ncbi:MAG: aminotransferase class I/II-fold pyridoxal phosphate-dependent enzyme [Acidimicrobiia bacterium]